MRSLDEPAVAVKVLSKMILVDEPDLGGVKFTLILYLQDQVHQSR